MSQVINNIVLNALQSMPEGDEIKVVVENVVIGNTPPLALEA